MGLWRVWAWAALLHPSARESCRDELRRDPGLGHGCRGSLGPCWSLRGDDAPWHRGALQAWPLPPTAPCLSSRSLARPETCVSSGSLSKMPTAGKQQKPKLSFCLDSYQFPELNNRLFQASLLQFWLFGLGLNAGKAALWVRERGRRSRFVG